ncbi:MULTISPECIES: Stp1/IreP family PP2C-type Ser/Thr phosphatase [Thermoanaerobacterium]|uniref:Protein serine/threonine phosphatase n=2 Tax=Thermoanaerobacterium TaxID=28895 RepID=W9EBZ0_9THEO|nr:MULTISPECIES: Stp1/IreP family PP2C-type Ser/Thr phosphatase [Thermoanaerobacterium]AFK86731.1 protein serine/threonine phosphatase [Thermoanaerobacterium saccharolyticum JW/SL-YS485]ETO38510.1 protein serine/threonine phosphatase [Thermoanaerobacterium aotearoense SCUT27]
MLVYALTDKGNVRENNEDSYFISTDERIKLFIVADGMGGCNGGEVASRYAIEVITKYFFSNYSSCNKNDNSIKKFIEDAVRSANSHVFNKSFSNIDLTGMGTTLTLLLIENKKFFIGHIGDSRAYLIRGDKLMQITEDHSYVEELVKLGRITHEEARNHPQKNIITRALGIDEEIEVDIFTGDVFENDVFLLCTDGLTNMLTDDLILKEFNSSESIDKACDNLIKMAKQNGGFDNITIVAVKEV